MSAAVQLWSVRDQLKSEPEKTLRKLYDLGFREAEGFDLMRLAELKPILEDVGLKVRSSFLFWLHVTGNHPLAEKINYPWMPDRWGVEYEIERALRLGLDTLVIGYLLPEERESFDQIQQLTDKFNIAAEKCAEAGLRLAYHNHTFEFQPIGGTNAYQYFLTHTEGLGFELDTLWAQVGGNDLRSLTAMLGDRLWQLHLKDGLVGSDVLFDHHKFPTRSHHVALGKGDVGFEGVSDTIRSLGPERVFVEQEYSAELFDDLGRSRVFLEQKLRVF